MARKKKMQGLPTFEDMADESADFETRFDELIEGPTPRQQLAQLVADIQTWLAICHDHGRYVASGSAERRALKGIVEYWRSTLRRHDFAVPVTDELAPFDPTAGVPLEVDCPYPGLDPYTPDHSARFFGRESLVDTCVTNLENPAKRLVMIIGASGSGKSSLALGGVRPRLREMHGDDWIFAQWFSPGADPLHAMAVAILAEAQPGADDVAADTLAAQLGANPGDTIARCAEACGGKPLFMVIDQFEELLTLCRDAARRQAFADCLCALGAPDAGLGSFRCHIMFTLRTDQLGRFEHDDGLHELHSLLVGGDNYFNLAAIELKDIRRAIATPAEAVGLRFVPPSLIDTLASQTAGLANGLPLLQFALLRLWDTRCRDAEGRPLDFVSEAMVKALPDVKGALGTVAESLYEKFSAIQKEICERLLLELVVLDETFEEPLRRRRDEAELVAVLAARFPGERAAIDEVIGRFVESHLLRRFGDAAMPRLEVAHEALLRHWKRINEKLLGAEVKETLHLIKLIGRDAADWAVRGRQETYLNLRGERLDCATRLTSEGWLAEEETREYVEACRALSARRKAEAEKSAKEKQEREKAERERTQAQLREAKAKAARAKASVVALIAVAGLLVVVFVAWSKIDAAETAARTKKEVADANAMAFTSISAALPPMEALDLAFTLVRKGEEGALLPLAHAMERTDYTWQLGEGREGEIYLNRDGSAAYRMKFRKTRDVGGNRQIEGADIYLIDPNTEGVNPEKHRVELRSDGQDIGQLVIGPLRANGQGQLVLLFSKRANAGTANDGLSVEAYLVTRKAGSQPSLERLTANPDERAAALLLANVDGFSPPNYSADGERAVFTIMRRSHEQTGNRSLWSSGEILKIELNGNTVDLTTMTDPKAMEENPSAPIAAALLGQRLVTLRSTGELFCGEQAVSDLRRSDGRRPTYGWLVTHPDTHAVGLQHDDGQSWVVTCDDRTKLLDKARPDGVRAVPGTLALADLRDIDGPVVSYVDDGRMRCVQLVNDHDPSAPKLVRRWFNCSPAHRVAAGILTTDRHLVLVENKDTPVLQRIPVGARGAREPGRNGEMASAGSVLRLDQENKLEWRKPGQGPQYLEGSGRILQFALSRSGDRAAWIEEKKAEFCTATWHGKKSCMGIDATPGQSSNVLGLAVSDAGRIAMIHVRTQEGKNHYELATGEKPPADIASEPSTLRPNITCMRFSQDGKWLVVGRNRALIRIALTEGGSYQSKEDVVDLTDETPSTCDIDNAGRIAAGFESRGVVLFERAEDGTQRSDLSQKVYYRFPVGVKALAFYDIAGRHLLVALGREQPYGCSRPGLAGQTLRAWDLDLPSELRETPVSDTCFPNRSLAGIGEPDAQDGMPIKFTLYSADGKRLEHTCHGCLRQGESSLADLRQRLSEEARDKRHAQNLPPDILSSRYGLKGYDSK